VVLAGELGGRGKVGDPHQRIGHRLQIEEPGARRHRLPPGGGVVSGDEGDLDAQAGQVARHQIVRPSVEAVLREHVVARLEIREEGRADGRHPAGGGERGFRPFQGRELRVQHVVGGRVREAGVADVVVSASFRLLEGARLIDRHRHRAAVARAGLSGVDQQGIGPHGARI